MASTQVERPVTVELPASDGPSPEGIDAELLDVEPDKKEESSKTEKHDKRKHSNNNNHHQQQSNQHKRFRHDNDNRHFKFGRKRSYSFTGGNGKFGPSHKRWKRDFFVPPTKFLLGGNICDPLNLNSLQDEDINRAMNAVTPQSSPLPTPKHRKEAIEVLIPPNIHDPLNLTAPDDDPNYELRLISPKKKKPRHRRRKSASACAAAATATTSTAASTSTVTSDSAISVTDDATEEIKTEEIVKAEENVGVAEETLQKTEDKPPCEKKPARRSNEGRVNERRPRRSLDDKIVSPVIPQPGAWKRPFPVFNRNLSWEPHGGTRNRKNQRNRNKNRNKSESQGTPVFKPGNAKFQFGNYNRYYGYRNQNQEVDSRMKFLRKDMFYGKEVLDIGCNVGHVTLTVAQQLGARRVVGIDIDRKLVKAAKQNVRHYASCQPVDCDEQFPACMPVLYGALDGPVATGTQTLKFPHNVSFTYGNYVLESDILLNLERPQFDIILCLSVTKWLHLNFGDEGLKRAFRRMHAQLRPGGKLILEAQAWNSYGSKKKLTEKIFDNYKSIQLFPQKFTEYLLSSEVGFTKCEVIGTPAHNSRGFQRPIQMFTKAELPHNSPSETVPSTACGDAALPTETSVIRPSVEMVHHMAVEEEEWEAGTPEYERLQEDPTPEPEVAPEMEVEVAKTPGSEASCSSSKEQAAEGKSVTGDKECKDSSEHQMSNVEAERDSESNDEDLDDTRQAKRHKSSDE